MKKILKYALIGFAIFLFIGVIPAVSIILAANVSPWFLIWTVVNMSAVIGAVVYYVCEW